ncbi:hypothetical protein AwDysgo_11320 [Bacteroidales bacterium]|nr:hypothetical protein AwDysgo_11320 [Bacteroidales bacterium]
MVVEYLSGLLLCKKGHKNMERMAEVWHWDGKEEKAQKENLAHNTGREVEVFIQ